jgi:ubiquitin carboxyl-terminal hydrolase 2/21/ubiquitin carboxyl-terminal hydrolase 8
MLQIMALLYMHNLSMLLYLQALQLRPGGTVSPVYQLVAVSHHTGSLEGGHYTATARSASDSQWYNFNDSHVRRDAKPGGASSSAYVLVYRLESL